MYTKELVFSLILLMQACGPLLAQELTAVPTPEPPGILQRLANRAREVKATVQNIGITVMDFAGTYYEDHIQPVADSYAEWASDIKTSVVEKIQTTIDNYMPLKANNSD